MDRVEGTKQLQPRFSEVILKDINLSGVLAQATGEAQNMFPMGTPREGAVTTCQLSAYLHCTDLSSAWVLRVRKIISCQESSS